MTRALARRVRELEASGRIPPLRPPRDPLLEVLSDDELRELQTAVTTSKHPATDPDDRQRAKERAAGIYDLARARLASNTEGKLP
ncbi:hypothetical protein [Rubrimonas cliftonensis]|uniref:Uncharacterized protein n=1 Tax=Rubrimonas cliftonensis TaxID=89524 RepID=A0A1H4F209_9RHOB|nr:hypothetical protein [Rubrimonas cliftonensis]SEA91020.1 hypothetical protein SAMN05444370_11763 [Rubrimonas cliftonensis]